MKRNEHGTKNTWHDTETNLTWELKTTENVGDIFARTEKFAEDGKPDTHSYCLKLNSEEFGGFSDWRLPTEKELSDLCDKKKNIGLFSSGYYWSSTPYENSKYGAWVVGFDDGYVNFYGKNDNYYVRCVRTVV